LKLLGFQKLLAFDWLGLGSFLDLIESFFADVALCHGFNMPTFIAIDRDFC
jgi:hypothetical protein